jgi:hypothetical protein
MKNSIIILSVFTMTLSSFNTIENSRPGDAAVERMAQRVVTALQHNSVLEYATLYPELAMFHEIMEKNSAYYGKNIEEAKKDFELQYTQKVLPALNQSFNSIIAKGKKAGIDWNEIKLVNTEFGKESTNSPVTITFASNGEEYHLKFDKALFINGEWKVTQYAGLI